MSNIDREILEAAFARKGMKVTPYQRARIRQAKAATPAGRQLERARFLQQVFEARGINLPLDSIMNPVFVNKRGGELP